MTSKICAVMLMTLATALPGTAALAATPAEDAAAATKLWVKAVIERDVDTQVKMLPKRLFATPEQIDRERKSRLHDKEMAIINGEKYLSFDVEPTGQSGKVGNMIVMVFPYRAVVQVRQGKLQRESSLLAVAEEGSSNWSVIDGSGQNPRSIKVFVPGYTGVPSVPVARSVLLKPE